jgi:hypothetical protein
MTNEYLKWTIILFILRVPLETVVQAVLLKRKKIKCNVPGTDDKEVGIDWLQTSRVGRAFTIIQVVILIIGVISAHQTLF